MGHCCLFLRLIDGPLMTTRNKFHCFLTDDQIRELADVVIEQFGNGLSGDELVESIRLVMEDIPGIEMESTRNIHHVTYLIGNLYHDNI